MKLDERRLAWILLGVAMCVSATWLMIAGKDLTFSSDDIFYYGRLVDHDGVVGSPAGSNISSPRTTATCRSSAN